MKTIAASPGESPPRWWGGGGLFSRGRRSRSAAENMVSLRRFFATATITREKTLDDLSMMSRWPNVGGSNDPGYTAMVFILAPFPR